MTVPLFHRYSLILSAWLSQQLRVTVSLVQHVYHLHVANLRGADVINFDSTLK